MDKPSGIHRIAVAGATGMLGQPVTRALVEAGVEVTVISRHPENARARFPGLRVVEGDVMHPASLRAALDGQDAVYLSLNRTGEKPSAPHTEEEGLGNVIEVAKAVGLKRVALLSALVTRYQGTDGFDWWAFRVKEAAVRMLKESGVPCTIFYPSTFMETILRDYRQGNRLLLIGKSVGKQYWIAGEDYGRQVARSFQRGASENREYIVQGPQAFTTEEALKVFAEHWPGDPLKITRFPAALLKVIGLFNQTVRDGWHILTALNKYDEAFEAQETWNELGTPTLTLAGFARNSLTTDDGRPTTV